MMRRAILVGMLGMSGCTGLGPTAERPCYVQPSRWMGDDQNPVARMVVMNVGKACGISLSVDLRAPERSGEIVSQPDHGTARVRRAGDAMAATYTPMPGYAGEDSFRARLGPGSQVIRIDVTIRPPQG